MIARVSTRLACTRRHRDRPCLHTPCLHTSSPSTSCMHPHKSAPIAALPHRVPRPWNCHPSAVEVILHRPQEPPPPKPLSPRVRDHRPARPLSYTLLTPVALRVPSAMHERDRPEVHGVQNSSKLATPTDALRNPKRRSKFVQHSQSSESASRCSTALTLATTCAETVPEQSSRTARRCGTTRGTWEEEQTKVYYDCKQFVLRFFLCSARV